MANEITTTTFNDLFVTYVANEVYMAAGDFGGIEGLLEYKSIPAGSKECRFPTLSTASATSLGEGSSYANVAATTTAGTAVAAEIGMVFRASRLAWKSDKFGLANQWAKQAAQGIMSARETALCTLFGSMGTTIGSTNVALTVANFLGGIYKLEAEGNLNGGIVAVLEPVAAQHLRAAVSASTGTPFSVLGERFLGSQDMRQQSGSLFDVPIYLSNNVQAINTSDFASALFVSSMSPSGGWAGIGEVAGIEAEVSFDQSTSQYAATIASLWGVAEIAEPKGCYIVHSDTIS